MEEDSKNLLRCPNGCGLVADFTAIYKCSRCSKVLCGNCTHRFQKKPFCKRCHKEASREHNRSRETGGEKN